MANALKLPDDSLQAQAKGDWWLKTTSQKIERGRLLWALLPHVEQPPREIVPIARSEATNHKRFEFKVADTSIADAKKAKQQTRLPVGAIPPIPGELHLVYRAKVRPCIVVSTGGEAVPADLRDRSTGYQTNETMIVAPYYGADRDGSRGGWDPEFVERIRHCEWPQYMYERLPLDGSVESVLRLDHQQPIGKYRTCYALTDYQMSPAALYIFDEYLEWIQTGEIPPDSLVHIFRSQYYSEP